MEDSPLETVGRKVRRLWFNDLPEEKRDAIITPHFNAACPKDADKRKMKQRLEQKPEWYKSD